MNTSVKKLHSILASTVTCSSVILIVFALFTGTSLSHPTRLHWASQNRFSTVIHQHGDAALPAALVPIVAQNFAAHSPDTWRARTVSGAIVFNNPAQRLSARFNAHDVTLRVKGNPHQGIAMRLLALHSRKVQYPITRTALYVHGNRVELKYGHGLVEWYVNSPLGVEQGFTLLEPPAPKVRNQSLALMLKLHGTLVPALKGNVLEFGNAKGGVVLRYGDLLAHDAEHHVLPSHMVLEDNTLALIIDTRGAHYPLTIDPLVSTVTTFSDPPATANDQFGFSVALSANGTTALIGAKGTSGSAGTVYVFTQNNGSWANIPTQIFNDPAANSLDQFGSSVALSADGSIALIGASGTTVSGESSAGAAYVFAQTNGAWSSTPTQTFDDPAMTSKDNFGSSVALSGNGTTALIGAYGTMVSGKNSAGAAYVYTESSGIWPATPTQIFSDPSAATGDNFGRSVPLSADGNTALIGAPSTQVSGQSLAGTAYLYTQSNGSWPNTPVFTFEIPLLPAKVSLVPVSPPPPPPTPHSGSGGGGSLWPLSLLLLALLMHLRKRKA